MSRPLLCLVVVALAALSVGVGAASLRGKGSLHRALQNVKRAQEHPSLVQLQEHVNQQIEDIMEMHLGSNKKPNGKKESKKDKAEKNVKLDNSLDLKSMGASYVEGKEAKQPRHVVIAFLSIAWEAMQRGRAAIQQLKLQLQHEEYNLKVEDHNLKAWVKSQKALSAHKIKVEQERIGRMMDEVSHLQHITADAVAKRVAYEKQSSFLVAEHQLQSTPPIMPAVAAAALSTEQYRAALEKLAAYREKAIQIIDQTRKGIESRNHLISMGNEWVNRSTTALKLWEAKQNKIVNQRLGMRRNHIAAVKKRQEDVKLIEKNAQLRHSQYKQTLQRMDLKAQIKALEDQEKMYRKVKTVNAYDTGKMRAFLESIKLEKGELSNQLKTHPGKTKVMPPPAAWGVLAGFHPPGLHPMTPYPELHLPVFQPPAIAQAYPGSTSAGMLTQGLSPLQTAVPMLQPFALPPSAGGLSATVFTGGMAAKANAITSALPAGNFQLNPAYALGGAAPTAASATATASKAKFRQLSGLPEGVPPPPLEDFPPPPQVDHNGIDT